MRKTEPRVHFHERLDDLTASVDSMGKAAGDALQMAVRSLMERNPDLAEQVIERDKEINRMEVEIEKACLNLLALQQPVARDLRVIGSVLKMATDLERMGNHARDICRIVLRIGDEPLIKPLVDIPAMAKIAEDILSDSLKALRDGDSDSLYDAAAKDDEMDRLFSLVFDELVELECDSRKLPQATYLMLIAAHIERAGDHAFNVAEWVLYAVSGERHELNG